jgi:hypothetical protein
MVLIQSKKFTKKMNPEIAEVIDAIRSGQLGIIRAIPPELLVRIVEDHLEPREILRLCRTSREFNQMFCQDSAFWRHLYQRDYEVDPIIYNLGPENYRDLYIARATGHVNPHLQGLIGELVRVKLGIDPTPDALRLADPDIFVGGFARVCQRPRQPVVISREVFNREYDLIQLLQNIFEFRTLEYHGHYYLPRFILNIQQGSLPVSFIGLQRPPPNSQWPLPCAYTNRHTAEFSITQYGNRFGVTSRYV